MKVSFKLLSKIKSETILIKPTYQLVYNFCCRSFGWTRIKFQINNGMWWTCQAGFHIHMISFTRCSINILNAQRWIFFSLRFLGQGGSSKFGTSLNWSLDACIFAHRLNLYARSCSWFAARLNCSGATVLHMFVYLTDSWSYPPNLLCSTFFS